MDVSALRAEIKAWERDFKAQNGAEPTVQDIKDRPHIAEKYKSYKKLSKGVATKTTQAAPFKPREITKTEAPTVTNNPFSPVKNKTRSPGPARRLFATPRKELSPDPFPPIQVASSSQIAANPPPNSAVARARKRLRGEPVSPSPVKIKRQRVDTSRISLQLSRKSSDDEGEGTDHEEETASLIFDSPVKAPAGFTSLFNENPDTIVPMRPLTRTSTATGLFDRAANVFGDDEPNTRPAKNKTRGGKLLAPKGHLSRKRSLSDTEMEQPKLQPPPNPLLPPSPPADTSTRNRYDIKGKGKHKLKSKIPVNEDSDDESDEEHVKILESRRDQTEVKEHEDWQDQVFLGPKTRESAPETVQNAAGEFTINLPEELLQVLAISPSKSALYQEERLVRALRQGTRAGTFDPNRGGHIFHVGETGFDELDQAEDWGDVVVSKQGGQSEDDEWEEGEGVPWDGGF